MGSSVLLDSRVGHSPLGSIVPWTSLYACVDMQLTGRICRPVAHAMQLTSEKIDEFFNKYRGSDSERQEVLESFRKCKGDMEALFEHVTCSEAALDSHRFMDMIDAEIQAGSVESTKKYKLWKVAMSKRKRPKNPLKPKKTVAESSGMDSDTALVAAIQSRVRVNLNQSAVQDRLVEPTDTSCSMTQPKNDTLIQRGHQTTSMMIGHHAR